MSASGGTPPTGARLSENADYVALGQKLDTLETRLSDTNRMLSMDRKHRLASCSKELYDASWNESIDVHKNIMIGACFATLALGTAAGYYFMAQGNALGARLSALAGLGGCFYATPRLYAKAVKKLVIPGQVDRKVVPALQKEQRQLQKAVEQLRQRRDQMVTASVQANYLEPPKDSIDFEVDEASVTIGDFTIDVR